MRLKDNWIMFISKKNNVFFNKCAISLIVLMVLFSLPSYCYSHSSEHPSFKYSRKANENFETDSPEHGHDIKHVHQNDITKIWLYSMGCTFLISAAPFLLLFSIPLDNSDEMRPRLKVILAFASGGLLGDAFLHLIPHARNPHHSHDHSHENAHETHSLGHGKDTEIGLWVLGGIIAFLTVEKCVRLFNVEEKFNHGHSHTSPKTTSQELKKNKNHENSEKTSKKIKKKDKDSKDAVEISGYLNLAADFAHNFTDGLAIGASFIAGNSIGVVTTITILLHEVPHEIGDFAILIKSGCSRKKAIFLQLVTAIGALSGNALALIGVGKTDGALPWVLPFTAGGFIYIATVSVLPELLEGSTKLGQSIKEISALLTGVIIMVFISNFE